MMISLYIDPGFGSLFIQGLVTAVVGISFYFNKVKSALGFVPKSSEAIEEHSQN
jgi:hypothetical protein